MTATRASGTSQIIRNRISDISSSAIFVCGVAERCLHPTERLVIHRNLERRTQPNLLSR